MTRFIERFKEGKERVAQKIFAAVDKRVIDREARRRLKNSRALIRGISKETIDEEYNRVMLNPDLSETRKEIYKLDKRITDRAIEIRDARQQQVEA